METHSSVVVGMVHCGSTIFCSSLAWSVFNLSPREMEEDRAEFVEVLRWGITENYSSLVPGLRFPEFDWVHLA